MINARFCTRILFVLALCFSAAQAQQSNSPTRNEADEALRQKAFDLLESLAGQISILQSPENRARIGANIADSLWEHDEARARTMLVTVQEEINAALQSSEANPNADMQRRMVFLQLRINTVERIAKHNPELALAFFRATELPVDPSQPDKAARRMDERAFEMRLAGQIATSNPEIALDLAHRSLANGLSLDLIPLLRQISRKHKEQALSLYDEILAKLKHTNLMEDELAFDFAQNLTRSFTPPAIDDARFREVLGLLINVAVSNGCAGKMDEEDERRYRCEQIGPLIPLIKKFEPARAASLKHWESESEDASGSYFPYEELREVTENGSVEDVLALAKKYPQMEGSIYWQAVQKAQAAGDNEQARKIVSEYSGEPEFKQNLLELLDRHDKLVAAAREKTKELDEALEKARTVEERVALLMFMANQVASTDKQAATKLFDRAAGLVDMMKPGKEQLTVQIGLALMYCSMGKTRGLIIMETLIPKLNELVSAAAKLDGYENNYLRDSEWNMTREGIIGGLLTELSGSASYFAWCDFDRAVSVAGQFERPEIRLMAQVKLAQGILAGRPKPRLMGAPMWDY